MELEKRRACPGCQSLMGRVFARAVELDFCQFCGGVWFDAGEVNALTGKLETLEDPGPRDLSCPDCHQPMERGSLAGCRVERCEACSGTYVPPDTLDRLAGEKVRMLPLPDASRREESLDFRCPGCGERFPIASAVPTGRGLACWRCAGTLEEIDNPSSMVAPVGGNANLGPGMSRYDFTPVDLLADQAQARSENEVLHSPVLSTLLSFVQFFL